MQELLANFKNWLIANNLSKASVDKTMRHATVFFQETNLVDLSSINSKFLYEYFARLKDTVKLSQTEWNARHYTIGKLLAWQNIYDVKLPRTKSPVHKVKDIVYEEQLMKEVEPLLDLIFDNVLRVKTIIYFMFFTGLRISEVASIHRKDIRLEESEIIVDIAKQNMQKRVILTPYIVKLIETYFASEAETINAFNASVKQIRTIIKKLNEQEVFGKGVHITPHRFRASFACHCKSKGIDIEDIQDLLGHRKINTTILYMKSDQKALKGRFLKAMEADKQQ